MEVSQVHNDAVDPLINCSDTALRLGVGFIGPPYRYYGGGLSLILVIGILIILLRKRLSAFSQGHNLQTIARHPQESTASRLRANSWVWAQVHS